MSERLQRWCDSGDGMELPTGYFDGQLYCEADSVGVLEDRIAALEALLSRICYWTERTTSKGMAPPWWVENVTEDALSLGVKEAEPEPESGRQEEGGADA